MKNPDNKRIQYSIFKEYLQCFLVFFVFFFFRLPCDCLIGGVNAMTKEQLELVNGYSNKFYGWGGEDDDLYNR